MSISEKTHRTTPRKRLDPASSVSYNARSVTSEGYVEADVGHRMQILRKRCGLSIRQLAERAQVTASVISCIERGKNSPSIATLHKIVTAMGSDLTAFFSNGTSKQEGPVLRRELMQTVSDGHRHYTIVFAGADAVELEILDEQFYLAEEKPEFEELKSDIFGCLIAGSIVLEVGDRPPETLRPGDAFFVPRGQTHRGYAVGKEAARLITVHHPLRY